MQNLKLKEDFIEMMKKNFEEWQNLGLCSSANELNQKIGQEYFGVTNPHFFTGDFESELVLVHLNPKRKKDPNENAYKRFTPEELGFKSFDDYMFHFSNFGKINYGVDSPRTHKSPFDKKQIRFLKPFDIIALNETDEFKNLENVIDKKLQLELIPFGSNDFNYSLIGISNLSPYIDQILSFLSYRDRKYIIFCGRVFEKILKNYIKESNIIKFKLTKKDGSETRDCFEIINLKILANNSILQCAIAPQFAKKGYPVAEYGQKIKSLYGIF